MIHPHGAVLPTGIGMAEMPVELSEAVRLLEILKSMICKKYKIYRVISFDI